VFIGSVRHDGFKPECEPVGCSDALPFQMFLESALRHHQPTVVILAQCNKSTVPATPAASLRAGRRSRHAVRAVASGGPRGPYKPGQPRSGRLRKARLRFGGRWAPTSQWDIRPRRWWNLLPACADQPGLLPPSRDGGEVYCRAKSFWRHRQYRAYWCGALDPLDGRNRSNARESIRNAGQRPCWGFGCGARLAVGGSL
jgi:hypothetical protein